MGLLTALGLLAGGVQAMDGVEISMQGQINNVGESEREPFGKALMRLTTANNGTIQLKDDNAPIHAAAGSCSGTLLIKSGIPEGGGYCCYKDSTGDVLVVKWKAQRLNQDGGNDGTWEAMGGTGKYLEAKGGGSYHSVANKDGIGSTNHIETVN